MSQKKLLSGMKVIPGGNQMSLIRDTEEVVKFLELTARKSILNEHAVQCRLSACHNIFSVVEEQEDNIDYILQNLEVFIHRYRTKNNVSNDATVRVYKSRVKSSLEDFKAWCADPFLWERAQAQKPRHTHQSEPRKAKIPSGKKKKEIFVAPEPVEVEAVVESEPVQVQKSAPIVEESRPQPQKSAPKKASGEGLRISLPIREGFSIECFLPEDGLSLKEYHRIKSLLYAYCREAEFGDRPN